MVRSINSEWEIIALFPTYFLRIGKLKLLKSAIGRTFIRVYNPPEKTVDTRL